MFNLITLLVPTLINNLIFNYFYLNNKNVEYSIKFSSLFHSILSSLGGFLYLYDLISFENQKYIVYYSLGYIIFDLYSYTFKKELRYERMITYFHHLLFYIGIKYYDSEPIIYSRLILSEISTIPLNLMWISKYNNNLEYAKIFSIIFYVLFFVFRVVNCTNLLYNMFWYSDDNLKFYLLSVFSNLNFYWFYVMTKKLIIKLRN